jgi:cell division protein FtsW
MSATPTTVDPAALDQHPSAGSWDWPLFATAVALTALGWTAILSASSLEADATYGDAMHFAVRQAVGSFGGVILAIGSIYAKPSWTRRSGWWVYGLALLGLLLVLSPLGNEAKGATRWFQLGPINVQPSEFAKLGWIVMLSQYLSANEGRLRDTFAVVVPVLWLMSPLIGFMVIQKDFGTTVILMGLTGVLLVVAGLQWRWVVAGGAGAAAALAGLIAIEPYRIKRITSFLDPFADPDGAGYQVVQGWIALSTGGLMGQGLASGVAQRGFLPEAHTDFISAVIGEEFGALGWSAMILLLATLVWRAVVVASRAHDLFGMLVASGIAAMFGAQTIINVGVVGGLLPAKGLVLPFLSYGSSAAVVNVWAVGILLRISMERPLATAATLPAERASEPATGAGRRNPRSEARTRP